MSSARLTPTIPTILKIRTIPMTPTTLDPKEAC